MTEGVLATSRYIAFFDESGDHSLTQIDPDFPLFVLCTVIVERSVYASTIVPGFAAIKLKYFAHEGVNFHSRDIRKAIGAFSVLQNAVIREAFLNDVTELVRAAPFHLFVTAIDKRKLSARYGRAAHNPYDIALKLTFERILYFLRRQNERMLPIVAEARGRKEDAELQAGFYELISEGTEYHAAEEFRELECPLVFRNKHDNICGIQLADLCAHPSARHILKPNEPNRAFDVVRPHIYEHSKVRGWKVFPR